jgi:hypothetical protein
MLNLVWMPTGGDFTSNLAAALCLSFLPDTNPRPRYSTKTSRRWPYGSVKAPSPSVPNTCKQEPGSTTVGVSTRGRFYLKPGLWSLSLFFPPPTQDPVDPPKRVFVGRAAALRLRLFPCRTHARKNQVQLNSGCRHGGDFTVNLAASLCLSLLPVTHPRPRCSTHTSQRRPYGSATALPSYMPSIYELD